MNLTDELTQTLIEGYRIAGVKTGYWGRRFLQAVRSKGGLATVKRMLLPRNQQQRKGLDALLEAGYPELTVEAIILQPKFQPLFTKEGLRIAAERLGDFGKEIEILKARPPGLYPDELPPGRRYFEGARKRVSVNAYERDPRARAACVAHYGLACAVCDMTFADRYGTLGLPSYMSTTSSPLLSPMVSTRSIRLQIFGRSAQTAMPCSIVRIRR